MFVFFTVNNPTRWHGRANLLQSNFYKNSVQKNPKCTHCTNLLCVAFSEYFIGKTTNECNTVEHLEINLNDLSLTYRNENLAWKTERMNWYVYVLAWKIYGNLCELECHLLLQMHCFIVMRIWNISQWNNVMYHSESRMNKYTIYMKMNLVW